FKKVWRASRFPSISPSEARRSMALFRDCMSSEYRGIFNYQLPIANWRPQHDVVGFQSTIKNRQSTILTRKCPILAALFAARGGIHTHLHALRISTPGTCLA